MVPWPRIIVVCTTRLATATTSYHQAKRLEHLTGPDDFIIGQPIHPHRYGTTTRAECQMLCDAGLPVTTPTAPTFTDLWHRQRHLTPSRQRRALLGFVNGSATATAAGSLPDIGATHRRQSALGPGVNWHDSVVIHVSCDTGLHDHRHSSGSLSNTCPGPNNDLFIIPTQSGVTQWSCLGNKLSNYHRDGPAWLCSGPVQQHGHSPIAALPDPMPATPCSTDGHSITACGTYGSFSGGNYPRVTYTLTVGDGTQRRAYTVTATAQNYYFTGVPQTAWVAI